ncbi:MAG: CHAT domain-containing protein [Alphaproteobacteria bacterium]
MLSEQEKLAKYRVLHFATHGVLARDFIANDEPGLILTPPAKAQGNDDGLLTMSEILRLKLDANWVILSSTSTDEGKAKSAEALTDMARAFFYAGGRSVLASHWPANSRVTVKLVTSVLNAIAKDDSTPAEAVRLAMVELIDKGAPEEAHPEYWAPFVLVGEGCGAI